MINNRVLNTRYRLEKKIGQGGFAEVYMATDQLLKRNVAVKVLHSDLTEKDDFLERFEREAQSIAALDHPNILAIYDYGQAEETAYLVMPLVEGGTLNDKLRQKKKFDLPEANHYLQQAAAALDYAHRRNIVHRDIKPQNMLLRAEDDRLLLSDFGIAKVLSAASAQSRTGVMGTLSYMAPEQLEGNVGVGTDIYALGCVLFQMLTGELPYTGPTEQVMVGHMMKPIPSIVERSQGQLPAALQNVIERALAKKPENRYPTAGEMARAFQAVVNGYTGPVTAPADKTQLSSSNDRTEILSSPGFQAAPLPATYPYNQPQSSTNPHITGSSIPAQYVPGHTPPYSNTPPNYFTPPAPQYNATPPPSQPQRSGPNLALIGGIAGILLVAIIALVIILIVGGKKDNPTPVANITPTVAATTVATTAAVTTPAATTAGATTAPATTAAVTTAAPTTAAVDPVNEALKDASDTFFVKGDLNAGITKFRTLSVNYPSNAKVWRDYGQALHLWNRDAGGVEPLEKAAQLDPKDPLTFLYLMDTYIDAYRYPDAEKAAATATQLDPNGWIGHAAQASINNYTFKTAAAKPEVAAMQKAAGSAASDPYYNWLLSNNLFYTEDYKGALDAIEKTLKVWPNLPSVIAIKGAYLIYSPGDETTQQKGLDLLLQAQKLQPQSANILGQIASYYAVFARDFAKAEQYAQDAAKISENDPSIQNVLGQVQANKKDYEGAFKRYERCLQIDQLHLDCYFNWSLGLVDQGNDLSTAGKKPEATAAYKAATEKAQAASKIYPDGANYSWLMGYTYFVQGDYKSAIPAFQKAVNGLPNEANFYGWLGLSYLYDGQKDKAQAEYNKGVAIAPDNDTIKDLGDQLKKQ